MCGMGQLRRSLFMALAIMLAAACHCAAWGAPATARVEARPDRQGVVVTILSADAAQLDLHPFSLDNPPRLVFDLPGAVIPSDQPPVTPIGAAGIQQVRVGQFQADIVRIVLDLEEGVPPPAWQKDVSRPAVAGRPDELVITLGKPGPAVLEAPEVKSIEGGVLVVLAGGGQLPRHVATLDDPPRVFADLTDAELVGPVYRQPFEEGAISEIRMAQQPAPADHPVTRIVVELAETSPHIWYCDGADLVLALGPQPWALPLPPYRAARRLMGRSIVVDPGHGGKDIGAPARPGSPPEEPFEKDVVLDLGLRLARLLKAEGAEVALTREDDTYITLKHRAELANKLKAEAFISLHCNSYRTPDTLCGTSVYYDHDNSVELAKLVQEELVCALGTDDKGIRNANFAVIRRTQGPGVLVETAYINHQEDRARLTNPNARERAARAILQGVIRFLSQNPSQDSANE